VPFLGFAAAVWSQATRLQLGIAVFTVCLAVFGAAITFLTQTCHEEPPTLGAFLRFLLPRRLLTARQTWLDVGYVLVKHPARVLWRWGFVGKLICAALFYALLNAGWGTGSALMPTASRAPSLAEDVVFLGVAIALEDLLAFLAHLLMHKVPVLWEFHAVHHSALSLVPVTNRRFHPVQELWDALWVSGGIGLWIALFATARGLPLAAVTILGIDANILANCFSFHHLRHSHIYMRYPRWVERVLMSPAQHQIHHSRETRHLDRNFGLMFAWWDQLFGSIVYSEREPATNLGVVENQERYLTLWGLFAQPFIALERNHLRPLWRKRVPKPG
jgi:sterol desaturase/sphingolipid hydroxylase (fatty acid hydroxylase superfamily)